MPTCGVCGYSVVRLNHIVSSHLSVNFVPQTNFTEYSKYNFFLNKNFFFKNYNTEYKNIIINNLLQNENFDFKKVK